MGLPLISPELIMHKTTGLNMHKRSTPITPAQGTGHIPRSSTIAITRTPDRRDTPSRTTPTSRPSPISYIAISNTGPKPLTTGMSRPAIHTPPHQLLLASSELLITQNTTIAGTPLLRSP